MDVGENMNTVHGDRSNVGGWLGYELWLPRVWHDLTGRRKSLFVLWQSGTPMPTNVVFTRRLSNYD